MKQIDIPFSPFLAPKKILHQLIVFFFFALMPFSGIGQTTTPNCPNDPVPSSQLDLPKTDPGAFGSCTAKDIVIKEAFIDAGNPCNSCSPGTTLNADLILVVDNTQNSKRAMTVWADLVQTAPDGSSTICRVSRCFIPLKSSEEGIDSVQDVNTGNIMFTCGNALKLTNIVVAYSASGGGAVCPMTGFPPSKCDTTSDDIDIIPPLNAIVTAECGNGNTGNYDLTVSGGVGDFSYLWSNGATSEDLTDVSLGAYTVIVTDNGNNDGSGEPCTVTGGADFEGPCCEFTYNCPTFTPEPEVVECYTDIPTQTSYTEAEFEALGNGDGDIGDNPCGIVEITASNDSDPGCEGNVIRTFTITEYEDENGNEIRDSGEDNILNQTTCNHTYTVDLTTGPDAGADTGSTVECEADATEPTPPSINDACGNAITPSTAVKGGTYDGCEGTITYTFTYTDCAQNTDDWVYTYTVDLTTAPVVVPATGSSTVECQADAVTPTIPTIVDACDNPITPTGGLTTEGDYDGCEGTIVYRYTYTDCALNATDWVYTYTVDLTTGPDAGADAGSTVECEADATEPTPPSINDACGNAITPSTAVKGGTYDGCEGTITYTFTYTDCAQNTDDWVYTYTVDLTTAPVVVPATGSSTVECQADAVTPTIPTIVDACDNPITPTGGLTTEGDYDGCEGTIVYRYTYTDCALNATDWVYTYTVDLTTGPDAGADAGSTVECEADATEPTPPSINDACGNAITPSTAVKGGTYDGCEGTITYTFTYTDCAQNTDDWVYTYTVDLTTAPVVVPATGSSTVECQADAVTPTIPTIVDACDNPITPTGGLTTEGDYDGCEGTIVYRYTYTDCALNATDWVYTYTVDLTTGPDAGADAGSTVECEADATEPTPPSINDACGNAITPSTAVKGGTYDGCEGTITYTFTYTDCAQNTDDWVYTYTVDLTTAPVVVPATGSSTVECQADAVTPTIPTIVDACDNPITPTGGLTTEGDYDGCEGTIVYRYTYTDCALNATDWVYTYTVDLTTGPDAGADTGSTVECEADATEPTPPSINDACGNAITPSTAVKGGTYDGCEGTITYTFTYTDCAQNTDDWVYTYTVDLTTAPVVVPATGSSTVECQADAVTPTIPTIVDACDNPITPTGGLTTEGDYDGCEGTIVYRYTYTDCALNATDWVYTYTVDLTTGPDAGADAGSTVECEADATEPTPPSINDACGNAITPSTAVKGGTYDGCEGTITYTFTYTDCAQNTDDWVYTYTVDLTTAPVVVPATGSSTVECQADAVTPTIPTIVDACDNPITPTGGLTTEGDYDGCEGTIVYRYTYTDCALNATDWVYTYTVDLTTGPDAGADAGSTVECEADATEPTPPSINDACGNAITPSTAVKGGTYDGCEGTITYTFTYTDCAQNTDDWVYTYTVDLTTAPVVVPATGSSTVECQADAVTPTIPTIVDACDNPITPTGGLTTEGDYDGCEGTIVYRYTYTDCALNATDWVYTYTVDLTTGPDAGADAGSTVECEADATEPTPPSINDACGNAITPSTAVKGGTYDGCEGTITYTFTYTDCAQNTDDWVYTYTVDLTTAPVVVPATGSSTVECQADAVTPTIPTIVDACDNPITPTGGLTTEGDYDGCEGTIVYRYTYTDCALNATDWVYTYTVDLTTGPDAGADAGSTVECEADATEPTPPSINDACGNAITPSTAVKGGTYDGCEGTITYTFTYTDCAQNTDDWVYTYTVDLTTAPVVVPATGSSTVECQADAVTPTIPTIVDACDNPITPTGGLTTEGDYDGCEGTIVYRYTYTDCALNATDWVYTYTVDLTTGPDAGADAGSTVECEADATEPTPPSINDACGNAITPSTAVKGGTYDGCEGTITYTFTYTDCAQNTDDWVYTYTVDLTTAPVVVPATGSSTVECQADAVTPTIPTIVDACDNPITPTGGLTTEGDYDGCEGTIVYRYTYTDCALNATDWVYTYTVDLTTGPDAGADAGSTVECEADATEPTPPSINDACGNAITPSTAVKGGTYDGCEGTITYTFTYTDCAQNTDDWVYTYTVDLTTAPVVVPATGSSTVECQADAVTPTIPTIVDACDNPITPTGGLTTEGDYDGCEGTIVYRYTYTDCALNATDWVYTYTVDLTTGPDAGADTGSTVECEADATEPTPPSINDACGNAITPSTAVKGGTYDGCEGTITYTFTYTDCAQNTDDWVYTYTVDLTTAPVVVPATGSSTVECQADAVTPTIPTIVDACDNPITPTGGLTTEGDYDGCEGTIVYRYTYTDCALNATDWVYTYTVDDTVPPTITCPPTAVVLCGGSTHPDDTGNATATDNCDPNLTITYNDVTETTIGCDTDTITRTWTATDCAGNSSTCTQNILVASVNIVKSFTDDSVIAGGNDSSFTLVVTNDGSAPLSEIEIYDDVDETLFAGVDKGITVTDVSGDSGEDADTDGDAQTVEWLIDALDPGEFATITVTFDVAPDVLEANGAGGLNENPTFSNTASVKAVATDDESVTVDDEDDDTIDILVDIELEVVKTFVPSEIQVPQGTFQIFTIDVTNNGPSDAVDVAVTDMVNNILEVTAINVISGVGDCSASSGQDIACTVQIPSGDTVTIEVKYLSAPFFDDGGSPYGTIAGDDFYIIFLNGSVLEGSTDGGPVYFTDNRVPDGDGIRKDNTTEITIVNSLTRNEIIFDPPGDDLAFEMHLSCSDPFTGGWGQSAGPVEGVDVNWQIAYFSIGRYNSKRFIKSCGNVVNPFVIPNRAFADGEDSFGDEGDDDTATITIGPGITLDRLQTKGKRLTARLNNLTGDEKIIADIEVEWPNSNGNLSKVWLTYGNTSNVIWQGSNDPAEALLDSNHGNNWKGGTLLPGEAILRFDFQNKVANSGYIIRVNFTDGTWLDISVNGGVGATNTKTMEAIAIEETAPTEETRMLISPNPATTSIEVKLEGYDRDFAEIMLFDLNGRQLLRVKEKYTPGEILVIELPTGLNEGLYYVKLNDRGSVKSVPLIISRPD